MMLSGMKLPVAATVFGIFCAASNSAMAQDASRGKRILLAQGFVQHPYVATITKAFRERAEAFGMAVTVQAGGLDAALQVRQIDDGIARKFDLIAVQPVSEQAIIPALSRAKDDKIPVIITNNTPKENTEELYLTFVGQDQKEMGAIAGRAMLAALKASGREGGKIALITGALQSGIGPRRLAGIKEALASEPKAQIVAVEDGRWDTATSERIAGQLFARFAAQGGLDVVYGMADNQAVAAIRAAEAAGIPVGSGPKQLIVVGGNCLKEGIDAIKGGKMYSTVTQLPVELGRRAAEVVNDHFEGKALPKEVLLPINLVDRSNITSWSEPCTY